MADKAGRWFRVSTTSQNEGSQVPEVAAWCDDRGYEVARDYTMRGKAASKAAQQAALDEVLADMRAGVITVLVAWKDDRIERRGSLYMVPFINAVRDAGGRIEFVTQPALNDLSTMGGRISLAVMSEVAAAETQARADRMRIGQATARANGAALGMAPWGYRVAGPKYGKQFVLTDTGREWLPQIYAAVADGLSLTKAAVHFSGITGKKWSAATLAALIRNTTYRGTQTSEDGRVIHRCEPAVGARLWQGANDAINDPARKKRGPAGTKAPLAGVLACGECGSPMYRTAERKGHPTRHYRCSGKAHSLLVPTGALEAAAEYALIVRLEDVELTETRLVPGWNWDAEVKAVEWELRQLASQGLSEDAEDARRAELRAERRRLLALPSTADEWRTVGTGVSFSDAYQETEPGRRAAWLKAQGVIVRAWADRAEVSVPGAEAVVVPFAGGLGQVADVI